MLARAGLSRRFCQLFSAELTGVFVAGAVAFSIAIASILGELTALMLSIFVKMNIAKIHLAAFRCRSECDEIATKQGVDIAR
ncbi:MAG: hypothetical protein EBW71_10770 [Betaproteobacteria bacterium]|nr:hypothetical protein [Betaproteobacteria bacterium]